MLHLSLEKQRGSAHPRCAVALRRSDPQGIDNLHNVDGRGIMRHEPLGVAAMIEKLVQGFVVVALMIMVTLAYAQKHEGCLRGRSLQTLQPCGSVGHDI